MELPKKHLLNVAGVVINPATEDGNIADIKTQADKLTFNSDGSLRVQFAASSRLLWDTDTDWNKGTGTFIEVSGTGPSAVIRPTSNSDSGNITYSTASDYSLSSGTDLEISGGTAHLKASSTTSNWSFTTPSDYTYGSDITVSGGNATLTPTPVIPYAWYHLNEASGTTITDSSGNGRNGTTVGSPSWVAAKLNNGLQLTGTQYGNLGDIASFERTDPFSVEMWIKTTDSSGTLIGRREASAPFRGWDIMYAAGVLYFYFANTTVSNMIAVNTALTIDDNAWHHIVVTYNGSSLASGVKIYRDGSSKSISTQYNSLTATTITTSPCNLGARSNSNHENGVYDEVVIYNRVLDPLEVTFRYNSGTGTETMVSGYVTSTPPIYPNTGIVSGLPVTSFTEASTKPTGAEIKYQVSSDDGVTWKYWTGSAWAVSDLTYSQASLASAVNTNIATLAISGTYRFRALLSSTGFATPLLDQVTITSSIYPTIDNLYVDTKNVSQIVATSLVAWTLSTFTDTLPAGVDARILFSVDGRSTWLTWNGASWVIPINAALRATATTIPNVTIGFSQLPIGSSTLDVRLFLYSSDVRYSPTVDNLLATYSKGFYTLASYETNVFDSHVVGQLWEIFDQSEIIPSGTSVVTRVRVSNNLSNMGSYGAPLTIGNSIGLNGEFIQFSMNFSGTLLARALVDYTAVRYSSPFVQDITP